MGRHRLPLCHAGLAMEDLLDDTPPGFWAEATVWPAAAPPVLPRQDLPMAWPWHQPFLLACVALLAILAVAATV